MELQAEHFFRCPWCGERISMILDLSVEDQSYVEDCEVCCRPIQIHVEVETGHVVGFDASTTA
jgi:transcription elongation factor Elf1